ncbi:MAG TPA: FtsW/RodA/SpoVE family cell cycle protein [Candidatus Paceibacterota bacterium]
MKVFSLSTLMSRSVGKVQGLPGGLRNLGARAGGAAPLLRGIDWFLFFAATTIALLGLLTMRSFSDGNIFFERQSIWIGVAVTLFFFACIPEYRFLRRTQVVAVLYGVVIALLLLVLLLGEVTKGAQSRFDLGLFAIQPSNLASLVLVIVLAKYFARRHVEIAHIRHILISGAYTLVLCALIFFQPDFGSALIIALVWLGMVLVAGISWKHLTALIAVSAIIGAGLWTYGLADYQKQRILTFVHPLTDIQGSGYNAYQSTIAVGSGEVLGKGIGYGTQSKLRFLPEYQSDFIFAAYAEEWGFGGVLLLFGLYGIVIVRVLSIAARGSDAFEMLFGVGVAVLFLAHFIIHIAMNMGLLPITGTTTPFMSYGGSHLITEYLALGILIGIRRHGRLSAQAEDKTESLGGVPL